MNFAETRQKKESEWEISGLVPLRSLTPTYVGAGFWGLKPIVLKLSLDTKGLKREADALRAFRGLGAISVLKEDEGALLLERAVPGETLKSYFPDKDLEAVQIACDVMKKLHKIPPGQKPSEGDFPRIQDWLKALDQDLDIPEAHLEKARDLRDKLLKTAEAPVLLHGDLHHDNIVKDGREWRIIDPKGVWGEPSYEIATFIRNPIPELLASEEGPANRMMYRIALFSKLLGINERRLQEWCFVGSVLAWSWALEDNIDAADFEALTKIFDGQG